MTLLAAYNFDEASGDFLDVTGNGHDIQIGANAARAAGHTGSALTKISTGMPVVADPAIGQTAHRTIMFWLLGTGGTWWVRWQSDSLGSGTWGILLLSGAVAVQARDAAGTLLSPRPQVPHPDDGQWHHYAATYDGSTVRLYLDGTLVDSGALAGGLYTSADRVDVAEWSTAATFMDDLRIYDEALDQPTIATLMDTPVEPGGGPVAGSVSLAATAGLAVSGVARRSGTVTLTASAGLTGVGSKTASGTAAFAASAALAASGARRAAGTVLFAAAAALATVGAKTDRGARTLAAVAGLAAAGTSRRSGTVTLSATATLTAARAGEQRDITLTATLAPQPAAPVTVGARRWTATLGDQP